MLHDGGGMLLVLNDFEAKRGGFSCPGDPDIHHIGFIQASRDGVDALNTRFKADGWPVPAPREYHGAWTFYFKALGGYFVEVATETRLRRTGAAAA